MEIEKEGFVLVFCLLVAIRKGYARKGQYNRLQGPVHTS